MKATEGFYKIHGDVYYGKYFDEDVLNESTMKFANPDKIKTDRPFKDNDTLVDFNQNHFLTEPELANFKSGIDILKNALCSEKTVEVNFPDDMEHTRPTKDRIREAIFSALNNIDNFNALDLYAGSGAMGLEALSTLVHALYTQLPVESFIPFLALT